MKWSFFLITQLNLCFNWGKNKLGVSTLSVIRFACPWFPKSQFICDCIFYIIHANCKVMLFCCWWITLCLYQEIIPLIHWETTTFSTPVLAVLVFASVAIFPTLLLPSSPSMWVAGMTFGYGFGFLLIISAAAVGVSLPYFIGSLFYHKIQVRSMILFC